MGACSQVYMIMVQTVLQMEVPDQLRGRVMGIYTMTYNMGPLGAAQAGGFAAAFSPAAAVAVAASVSSASPSTSVPPTPASATCAARRLRHSTALCSQAVLRRIGRTPATPRRRSDAFRPFPLGAGCIQGILSPRQPEGRSVAVRVITSIQTKPGAAEDFMYTWDRKR